MIQYLRTLLAREPGRVYSTVAAFAAMLVAYGVKVDPAPFLGFLAVLLGVTELARRKTVPAATTVELDEDTLNLLRRLVTLEAEVASEDAQEAAQVPGQGSLDV